MNLVNYALLAVALLWGCRDTKVYEGTVVRGSGFAAEIGFPTANVSIADLDLASGVNCCKVELESEKFNGICYTNQEQRPNLLEVHILDFHRTIYGKVLLIHILDRLRPPKKFEDTQELISAIKEDDRRCRNILR